MGYKIYSQFGGTRQTPQSQPIPGRNMIENNAGGYTFEINAWEQLHRFLILGSAAGTYYVGAQELTLRNAEAFIKCIQEDGERVVSMVEDISTNGRATNNDPALFVLAACMKLGNLSTKQAAERALPSVARIGTHILHFAQYIEIFGGWSELSRRAVRNWYQNTPLSNLVYQVTKYQQRDGWSHRDLLRLSHPKTEGIRNDVYYWITKGWEGIGQGIHPVEELRPIWALEAAKLTKSSFEIVRLIKTYGLTREMIPTHFLKEVRVWEALLENMPLTAMIRNLATMTRVGLLKPLSEGVGVVCERLTNQEYLKKSRVHPWTILNALDTYSQGTGKARNANVGWHSSGYVEEGPTWNPIPQIVDALDSAFYASFENVEPTGKRFCLGLDVSGSMDHELITTGFKKTKWGFDRIKGMSARQAAGAMSLVVAKTEKNYLPLAFDTRAYKLAISPRERLDDVVHILERTGGGGTDCAIPMAYCTQYAIPVDVFVVFTDSESWAGSVHPTQALQQYRKKTGINAKLIVVAMAATKCSIADPQDAGHINVVGMDTNLPQIISEFVK